jgi:hypothetical protein
MTVERTASSGDEGINDVLERVQLAGDLDFDWIGRVVVAQALKPVLEKIIEKPRPRPHVLDVEALLRLKVRGLEGVAEVCCVCKREGPDNIVVCRGNCC